MHRIKLVIEYDGSAYSGWQSQRNQDEGNVATIQETLESALRTFTGERPAITASGRTDAGVHSLGLVVAFQSESRHAPLSFKKALNALLPPDIRIISADKAEEGFHPRRSAKSKTYVYVINHSERKASPFIAKYSWVMPYALDIEAMREASAHLVGKHDFSAFRGAGCGAKSPERELYSIEISAGKTMPFLDFRLEGNFIVIRFKGNGFLRHMARNIAGTLVEAGRGRLSPARVKKILESRNRTKAGPTAPPQGLFLEKVFY